MPLVAELPPLDAGPPASPLAPAGPTLPPLLPPLPEWPESPALPAVAGVEGLESFEQPTKSATLTNDETRPAVNRRIKGRKLLFMPSDRSAIL
jgi:hypothetical protein